MKKYTYEDWWAGKVYLLYCPVSYFPKDKLKIGKQVDWNNFEEVEINKIKTKQKELFEEIGHKTLQSYKKIFLETYKKSKFKALYLNDELEDIKFIIFYSFGDINLNETYLFKLKNRTLVQNGFYFSRIKNYINETIKKGVDPSYDFIPSPNYKYQNHPHLIVTLPAQLFAQVCLDYYQWLISNYQKKHVIKSDEKDRKGTKEISQQEIANKVVLNFEELILYTGFSKSYLYKKTHTGKIPFSKPSGKLLFFKKSEIDEWLMDNKIKTADEVATEAATRVVLKK